MSFETLTEDMGIDSEMSRRPAGRSRSVDWQLVEPGWRRLSTWPETLPNGWW